MLPGNTYHLFNHANGKENLFAESRNYDFFLAKLSHYVLPVAHIYAYCLMPNHFHLLVKIRSEDKLIDFFTKKDKLEFREIEADSEIVGTTTGNQDFLIKKISKSFSNLFNSYTQAFNKMYDRMGSLFMQNIKREEINNDGSFCKVVHYIHANPVHHQFVKSIDQWAYSSYKTFLSTGTTKLEREYVLQVYGGVEWFLNIINSLLI